MEDVEELQQVEDVFEILTMGAAYHWTHHSYIRNGAPSILIFV